MSRFLDKLVVQLEQEAGSVIGMPKWTMYMMLRYKSDILGKVVIIPYGFSTDFASFPFLNYDGQASAVVHDYLCRMGEIPRPLADRVYKEALEVEGIGGASRWLRFAGARIGGWMGIGVVRRASP